MPSSPTISSPRNPIIKHVLRLRDNRFRQRAAAVLVDGTREIQRAISGGLALRTLFVADSPAAGSAAADASAADASAADLQQLTEAASSSVVWVTADVLSQIAYGSNPRAAVAVFDAPQDRTLGDLKLPANPLVVILVGIEKPGNAGAVFRSADAVGADAVILCEAQCDLFNPNLIRSSLGTVFTLPAVQASGAETIRWAAQHKLRCMTAIVDAARTFWDADFRGPAAIVLGSEAQGLGSQWRPQRLARPVASGGADDQSAVEMVAVSIPMLGTADSLNVSVTAAALLFEARRQRGSLSASIR